MILSFKKTCVQKKAKGLLITMDSYQLNPDYLLRQDGNRVILYSKRELSYGGEDWFTFIHPFQAMMLSFFGGESPLENEIASCAHFFIKNGLMLNILLIFKLILIHIVLLIS